MGERERASERERERVRARECVRERARESESERAREHPLSLSSCPSDGLENRQWCNSEGVYDRHVCCVVVHVHFAAGVHETSTKARVLVLGTPGHEHVAQGSTQT